MHKISGRWLLEQLAQNLDPHGEYDNDRVTIEILKFLAHLGIFDVENLKLDTLELRKELADFAASVQNDAIL